MWFIQIKMSYSEICTDRMGLPFIIYYGSQNILCNYALFIIHHCLRNASCSSQGRFLHTRI